MFGFIILSVIMFLLALSASISVGINSDSSVPMDRFLAGWNNFVKLSFFTYVPFVILSFNFVLGLAYIVVGIALFKTVMELKY